MSRKVSLGAVAAVLISIGALAQAGSAAASTPIRLVLAQGPAFAILGHSCGGIQEKVYATGFAADGYPQGVALLETSCGGSGRGGGYKSTKYTGSASVVWSWYGETRSYAKAEPGTELNPTFSAEDSHHDHIYNSAGSAYLETGEPPLQPPAAPTNVTAYVQEIENGEQVTLRLQVGWTPDPETAALISSSKIVATPVGSSAPVLETTIGGGSGGLVAPLERRTTYSITVTSTDAEGTSQASTPIEVSSVTPEEEAEKHQEELEPKPPEFGRCVKAQSSKEGKITYYYGGYTSAGCELTSPTHTGKYEWTGEIAKKGFTTAIKPLTKVTLEGTGKGKLTCTGESGSGEITGAKSVGSVVMTFTGCESAGARCTTGGLNEGEVRTAGLEGALGTEREVEKEGKEIFYPALDLFPPGKSGPVAEYTCAGSEPTTLSGSVLVPEPSGKKHLAGTLKWSQSAGLQKPESFEGGPRDVLSSQIGEQIGLSLSVTQTNEETVEINRTV